MNIELNSWQMFSILIKDNIENPIYFLKVIKDLDKLLDASFFYLIQTTPWLSPLVIVLKQMVHHVYAWIIRS